MTTTLRTLQDLTEHGLIDAGDAPALRPVAERYAIAVTPAMAALISGGPGSDPIARQFVPTTDELRTSPAELTDPIGDARHEVVPGVVHRYRDRVLLKVTHACPVYCRFCFRREMVGPGGAHTLDAGALERALDYIAGHPEIFEVILTGGDPFILAPRRISMLSERLGGIAHVGIVRWHTRVPVVDPERVTPELVAALRRAGKATYVGLHCNHPRELTPAAERAIAALVDAGIVLVSQTVLLKGLNDDPNILASLFRRFLMLRIKPYYLHHADLAPGTGHFRTGIAEGQAIMRALRGRLTGLAQPTYVLDIPGGIAKVPVGPVYLDGDAVIDPDGRRHPINPGQP
jgi:lysine 2,3-aminomutase